MFIKKTKKGFTLVELIVVVTILAILATIGFVSYSSYLVGVRDTNRYAQLISIHDGLQLYSTKNYLPQPDNLIEVKIEGIKIGSQGKSGANVLETIEFTKGGKDPKDGSYFTYYLSSNRVDFQLMTYLEEDPTSLGITSGVFPNINAIDYSDRYPVILGKKLGVMTHTNNNTPIEDDSEYSGAGEIDITDVTAPGIEYQAMITDTEVVETSELKTLTPNSSCKRIKQLKGGSTSGVYSVNPQGTTTYQVYCDMETEGGGWMFFMFFDADKDVSETGQEYFANEIGDYSSNREDTGQPYSIPISEFFDTEMMIVADDPGDESSDPKSIVRANDDGKLMFYKYDSSNTFFNKGPLTCSYGNNTGQVASADGVNYEYKIGLGGSYAAIHSTTCSTSSWMPRTAASSSAYLIGLVGGGPNAGTYVGATASYENDSWWYVR